MDNKGRRTPRERDQLLAESGILRVSPLGTQTIDLDSVFTRDVTTSGSFDFRKIKNVTFGKLLEAMPIPTLLIDGGHSIVFANEAARKMANGDETLVGRQFSSLFPDPTDGKQALSQVNRIFSHRKNGLFEALLEIAEKPFWCRLNLRSIRFKDARLALSLVEDLTVERKQLIISNKYQQLVDVFPIGIGEFVDAVKFHGIDPCPNCCTLYHDIGRGNGELARMRGEECIEDLGVRMKQLLPLNDDFTSQLSSWLIEGSSYSFLRDKRRRPRRADKIL